MIAGNGGSDLLQLITTAFLTPSSNVIISNPCFGPYHMFSSWTGAEIRDVPLTHPDYALDVKSILAAIDDDTRIIFITSPNNPTGTYIPRSVLDDIIINTPDDILIVCDEVYWQYADADDFARPLSHVIAGRPVIGLNSFSKAYGLAGLRVGYAYTTPSIAAYLRKIIRPFLIDSISLAATIAALKDEAHITHTISSNKEQRLLLAQGLTDRLIKHWPSQANFILIETPMSETDLTAELQVRNIMVRPAKGFGAPGCVRITVGDQQSTEATLWALDDIGKEHTLSF